MPAQRSMQEGHPHGSALHLLTSLTADYQSRSAQDGANMDADVSSTYESRSDPGAMADLPTQTDSLC
jgi:hypothetical protein